MNWKNQTPTLCSVLQCKTNLNFRPQSHWPKSLPAVAVNNFLLAGFDQALALNHQIDETAADSITELFVSLHPELSFVELARLCKCASGLAWFPFGSILRAYNCKETQQFHEVVQCALDTPAEFQLYCETKKWGMGDFLPLQAASEISLAEVFKKIPTAALSKSGSVKALELCIDLLIDENQRDDLGLQNPGLTGEAWLRHLFVLRYPESQGRDASAENRVRSISWPGNSQVRWVRHNDQSGIEVKLFVSQPSDLAKHMLSLEHIQELLEQEQLWQKQ